MMKIWVKGRSLLHDGAPLGMQNDSGVEKVEFILEKGEEPLPPFPGDRLPQLLPGRRFSGDGAPAEGRGGRRHGAPLAGEQ